MAKPKKTGVGFPAKLGPKPHGKVNLGKGNGFAAVKGAQVASPGMPGKKG
jgi:hypothetical protein